MVKNNEAEQKWLYYVSAKFKKDGKNYSFDSVLTKKGAEVLWYPTGLQIRKSPLSMSITQSVMQEDFDKGVIQDLVWGKQITVIKDDNGLYQEVK